MAIDSTISPPPPSPCNARKPISSPMFCDMPHSADPIRKITIAAWKSFLRPYWSPSLPHSGVAAVDASRYAVTTQDRCSRPPRSLTMVGSAVDTIVWSSAASSMPSSRAPMDTKTLPCTESRASVAAAVRRRTADSLTSTESCSPGGSPVPPPAGCLHPFRPLAGRCVGTLRVPGHAASLSTEGPGHPPS